MAILSIGMVLAWAVGCAPGERGAAVEIRFQDDPDSDAFGTVEAVGLPPEILERLSGDVPREVWAEVFPTRTGKLGEGDEELPPVLGHFEVHGSVIRFIPRFTFDAGLTYHAYFRGDRLALLSEEELPAVGSAELEFSMPRRGDGTAPRVTAVYPSAEELPENLLRIYVQFSEPMLIKQTQQHVRILDAEGNEVELPFVEVDNGLWDVRQERLTLFLHPGRIKRNVGPNSVLGPPLVEGETFRLVVDANFRSEAGVPMSGPFERTFRVVAADRQSPDPEDWTITAPASTDDPLVLVFPESLDHGLVQRFIIVENPAGLRVYGEITVAANETRWSFRPDEPWAPGDYTIRIHPQFEDLAGNRIGQLFETSGTGDPVDPQSEPASLSFQVR